MNQSMITVTKTQLLSYFPRASNENINGSVEPLNRIIKKYFINTRNRLCAFLAQIDVESGGLRFREENLNYSAERLLKVFPRYFKTLEEAQRYAGNPQAIANRVYSNRMGNGPEESGDGWRFRGAGWIQLTGKNNFQAFADDNKMKIEDAVNYARTIDGAWEVSGWFWNRNRLNMPADQGNIDEVSRIVNAGPAGSLSAVHGLQERRNSYERALRLFV